jgi:hypothetical protein
MIRKKPRKKLRCLHCKKRIGRYVKHTIAIHRHNEDGSKASKIIKGTCLDLEVGDRHLDFCNSDCWNMWVMTQTKGKRQKDK